MPPPSWTWVHELHPARSPSMPPVGGMANTSIITHTVTVNPAAAATPAIPPCRRRHSLQLRRHAGRQDFRLQIHRAGTYKYICTHHETDGMVGTVGSRRVLTALVEGLPHPSGAEEARVLQYSFVTPAKAGVHVLQMAKVSVDARARPSG